MSSKGVGKSELMTLASKLFGCAVPSRTCAARSSSEFPETKTRPTRCNCHRDGCEVIIYAGLYTMSAMRLSSSGSLFATPQFNMLLSGCIMACAYASSSSGAAAATSVEWGVIKRKAEQKVNQVRVICCRGQREMS